MTVAGRRRDSATHVERRGSGPTAAAAARLHRRRGDLGAVPSRRWRARPPVVVRPARPRRVRRAAGPGALRRRAAGGRPAGAARAAAIAAPAHVVGYSIGRAGRAAPRRSTTRSASRACVLESPSPGIADPAERAARRARATRRWPSCSSARASRRSSTAGSACRSSRARPRCRPSDARRSARPARATTRSASRQPARRRAGRAWRRSTTRCRRSRLPTAGASPARSTTVGRPARRGDRRRDPRRRPVVVAGAGHTVHSSARARSRASSPLDLVSVAGVLHPRKEPPMSSVTWTPVRRLHRHPLRALRTGIAKITINRPEVRNAFRPADRAARCIDAFAAHPRRRVDRRACCSPAPATRRSAPAATRRARRRRLRRRRRRGAAERARPAAPDPLAAEAGDRARRRLRDRRRARAARRLRPDDRGRQRDLRPDGPEGRLLRRRATASTLLARTRRPQEGARRSGTCAASTTPQQALEMGLVNTVVPLAELEDGGRRSGRDEILEKSPTAIRFLKARVQRRHRRAGRPPGVRRRRDAALLPDRRGAGGPHGLPREAQARLPQVPAAALMTWRPRRDRAQRRSTAAARRCASGPRLAARGPAARRCRPPSAGVVGLGAALAAGAAFRPRHGGRPALAVALLLQVVANLANDLFDFRAGADTPDRLGPAAGRGRGGSSTERQLEVAIALVIARGGAGRAVPGRRRRRRAARPRRRWRSSRRWRTPAGRGRTATTAWARCSCSCSSGSWRSSGRPTSRPARWEPLFLAAAVPVGRAGDGDPGGQQPARHPDRRRGRQADAAR